MDIILSIMNAMIATSRTRLVSRESLIPVVKNQTRLSQPISLITKWYKSIR